MESHNTDTNRPYSYLVKEIVDQQLSRGTSPSIQINIFAKSSSGVKKRGHSELPPVIPPNAVSLLDNNKKYKRPDVPAINDLLETIRIPKLTESKSLAFPLAENRAEKLLEEYKQMQSKKAQYTKIFAEAVRKSIGQSAILTLPEVPFEAGAKIAEPENNQVGSIPTSNEDVEKETLQKDETTLKLEVEDVLPKKSSSATIEVQTIDPPTSEQVGNATSNHELLIEQREELSRQIEEFKAKLKEREEEYEKKCKSTQRRSKEANELQEKLETEKERNQAQRKSIDSLTSSISFLTKQLEVYEEQRRQMHKYIQQLKGNIRVFCRVKPLAESKPTTVTFPEARSNSNMTIIEIGKEQRSVHIFDRVFPPPSTQLEIFSEVAPFLQSALDGDNVCIFAYGQTGSGKTYTMEGPAGDELFIDGKLTSTSGILPRAAHYIFSEISRLKQKGYTFKVSFSSIEIYNEELRDMLVEDSQKEVTLMSTKEGAEVKGLTEKEAKDTEEVIQWMKMASGNRKVGKTAMNERSSRSHSIYRVKISGDNPTSMKKFTGLLNIIDLAGSERAAKDAIVSKNETLLKEAKHINQSLTTLGRVLTMLADRRATKKAAIPYRESKLTRVLQNSLQFESKTLMFVNICPAIENLSQSKESLRFASTASLAC